MNEHMDPEDDYVMITDAEEHMRMKTAARQKTAEDTRAQLRGKTNWCSMLPLFNLIICSTV